MGKCRYFIKDMRYKRSYYLFLRSVWCEKALDLKRKVFWGAEWAYMKKVVLWNLVLG